MRMEYVRKTGWRDIFTSMMCKLSRRIFNKIEVMQARHHMKDATNITLPSSNCMAFQKKFEGVYARNHMQDPTNITVAT